MDQPDVEDKAEVEIDGEWYRIVRLEGIQFPASEGTGFERKGIPIRLHDRWLNKKDDKPLRLSPGKHTVRIAKVTSPNAISNPVEIEILPVAAEDALAPPAEVVDGKVRLRFTLADIKEATVTSGRRRSTVMLRHEVDPTAYKRILGAVDGTQELGFRGVGGWPWRRDRTDPMVEIQLKDGRKLVIEMSPRHEPHFRISEKSTPAGKQWMFFDSPEFLRVTEETILKGLRGLTAGGATFKDRYEAARQLWALNDRSARKVLQEALSADKPERMRLLAATDLADERDPLALDTLEEVGLTTMNKKTGYEVCLTLIEKYDPAAAIPVLKKIALEGQFPGKAGSVIGALRRDGTQEAAQAMIDLWGAGHYPGYALRDAVGWQFEEDEYEKCLVWWEKNKHRPRMELLADAVANDRRAGWHLHEVMRKLDIEAAAEALLAHLPDAQGSRLERITSALSSLTRSSPLLRDGDYYGMDKAAWQRWWQWRQRGALPEEKPPAMSIHELMKFREALTTFRVSISRRNVGRLRKMTIITPPKWTAEHWRKILVEDKSWIGRYRDVLETVVRGEFACFRLQDWAYDRMKQRRPDTDRGKKKDLLVIFQKIDEEWKVRALEFVAPNAKLADAFEPILKKMREEKATPVEGKKP